MVQDSPGPYFFAAEGVFVYLPQAPQVITRIAERFPGALIAFDTYGHGDVAAVTLFRSPSH